MTIAAVESALRHSRRVILEWAKIGEAHWPGENSWREDQTRYVAIDPVIRALEVWPKSHWPGFALRQTDVL